MPNGKRRTKPGELGEGPEGRLENIPAPGPAKPPRADAVEDGAAERVISEMDEQDVRERVENTQKDEIRAEAEPGKPNPPAPAKKGERLAKGEIEELRGSLIERKRRLATTMGRLSGDAVNNNPRELGEISALPSHLADLGTETFEQDKDLGLAERASAEIREIDQALERLKSGDYGVCENCEKPIPLERLRALPFATLCAICKAKQEAA